MSDPGRPIVARIRYEIQVANGPRTFELAGVEFVVSHSTDIVVLMRITEMQVMDHSQGGERWLLSDETIVGVIGDPFASSAREFLTLRTFLSAGGIIGIHKDLA